MAELTWLGHACFRLRGREATIVLDPVGRQRGYELKNLRADIITVSHHHVGHNNVEGVKGPFTLLDGPGEYEIKDIFITGVRTYHDAQRGAQRGYNTVFVIQFEEIVFCHLGDLGHPLSSEQVDQIGAIDVLLLPIAGGGLSSAQVAEVISQLEPALVVPMHYATASTPPGELETLERFAREMGVSPDTTPRDRLTLRKSDIPEETQIVILSDRGA